MHYIEEGYWLTVPEIAERYRLDVSGVRKACAKNWVPNTKVGKAGYIVRLEVADQRWGKRTEKGESNEG